jgi:hypothetical protein
VKKFAGLVVGSLASGIGLLAISSPAQALVSCTGNKTFGSAAGGSGANCGVLHVGGTFELDVTSFFASLGTSPFDGTQFGVGIVTSGQSQVSFSNVKAVVSGELTPLATPIPFAGPIAIWGGTTDPAPSGLGDPNPFGSALAVNGFTYSAASPAGTLGAFQEISFDFTQTGVGGFGSWKASPNDIKLTKVDSFIITGKLDSVGTGDPDASNIISFAVGPGGIPVSGSTVGGYFTAQVPGPLPLAGVAAAFAWSRRLRRKQAVGTRNEAL